MIKKILLIQVMIISGFTLFAQNDLIDTSLNVKLTDNLTDIEELIKQKADDKIQQALLIEFKNRYTKSDHISVNEQNDCYEITVSHPSMNGYTGGAEAYRIDKKTGITKMIWHEHPMELPEIEIMEEKEVKDIK